MLGLEFCRGCIRPALYEDEEYLVEFLEELGGDVACDAKLTKLAHGGYDLCLDTLKPPQI